MRAAAAWSCCIDALGEAVDRDCHRHAPRLRTPRVPDRAWKRPANPAAPTTTTRCSTCCAPTTSTPRFFGRNWPRSVTRWSWWAPVTGCGTSTFTSTTSARPSRPVFVRVSRIGSRWFDSPTPWVRPAAPVPRRQAGTAVVAVAPGEGLAHLFESEGVYVVEGGPTENPSTADVLSADACLPGRPRGAAAERLAGQRGGRGRRDRGPRAAVSRWLSCRRNRRCRAYPRWPCTIRADISATT